MSDIEIILVAATLAVMLGVPLLFNAFANGGRWLPGLVFTGLGAGGFGLVVWGFGVALDWRTVPDAFVSLAAAILN